MKHEEIKKILDAIDDLYTQTNLEIAKGGFDYGEKMNLFGFQRGLCQAKIKIIDKYNELKEQKRIKKMREWTEYKRVLKQAFFRQWIQEFVFGLIILLMFFITIRG